MSTKIKPSTLTSAQTPMGTTPGYMPGFGNDFETEALPGALPQGMNSPQKCNYGLYGEQLSAPLSPRPATRTSAHGATAFARRSNIHTATNKIDLPYWKSAPH